MFSAQLYSGNNDGARLRGDLNRSESGRAIQKLADTKYAFQIKLATNDPEKYGDAVGREVVARHYDSSLAEKRRGTGGTIPFKLAVRESRKFDAEFGGRSSYRHFVNGTTDIKIWVIEHAITDQSNAQLAKQEKSHGNVNHALKQAGATSRAERERTRALIEASPIDFRTDANPRMRRG